MATSQTKHHHSAMIAALARPAPMVFATPAVLARSPMLL
jgi:hypothetical protein